MATIRRILSLTFALFLFALGGAAWYFYLHYSDPETVKQLLLQWVAKVSPKAKIEIGSTTANLFRGVSLNQCSLRVKDDPLSDLLSLDSVTIVPDRQKLLEAKLHLRTITLSSPTLHLHRYADGSWNFQRLLTGKPIRFPSITDISIRDARIELTSEDPNQPAVTLEHVRGIVRLRPEGNASWELRGSHPLIEEFVVEGKADTVTETLEVLAKTVSPVKVADVGPYVPAKFRQKFEEIEDLGGLLDLHIAGTARKVEGKVDWDGMVRGQLRHATAYHIKLPYPVREGEARFVAQKDGLSISNVRFAMGSSHGELSIQLPGWDPEQLTIDGTIRGVELTTAVRKSLDEKLQVMWDRFQPEGFVDVSGQVIKCGDRYALAGHIDLHDNAFRFDKFAYPVRRVKGRADVQQDGSINYVLTGRAGTSDVLIEGRTIAGTLPIGIDVKLTGKNATLDEELIHALPPSAADVIRNLHPGHTTGDFVCTVQRTPGSHRITHQIELDVASSECTWTATPYRLEDVTGHLTVQPGRVAFHDFVGKSGEGLVHVEGTVWTGTEGSHTEVGVRAENVSIDEKLKRSLPLNVQKSIELLQASGNISFAANCVKEPDQELLLEMDLDPSGTIIEPVAFPYRLEGFDGHVIYRDGEVEWNTMTARHGPVTVSCSGSFHPKPHGGTIEFRNLESATLVWDESLHRAAPLHMKQSLEFLAPNRPFGIRYPQMRIEWEQGTEHHFTMEAEGGIALRNTDIMPAIGLKNVSGVWWGRGSIHDDETIFAGNLSLASATVNGLKITNVKSSFKSEGSELNLPNLRGDMYGGQVHGNIRANVGEHPAHECRLNLYGAKLQEYLQSRGGGAPTADGRVYLDLFLEGAGEDIGRLKGRGKLDVLDADIDHLPILQDLFRIGNLQPPCGRAFEEVNCDFRIEDRVVKIETLDLLGPPNLIGPSFNLFSDGEGTLQIDSLEMNLAVSARWGRGRLRVPVLTQSFNLASDQVWSFNITGPLDNPVITPAPLKGFFRFLEGNVDSDYAKRRKYR